MYAQLLNAKLNTETQVPNIYYFHLLLDALQARGIEFSIQNV